MAEGGANILRDLGMNWLECMDEQGVFYFNQVTQQSSDTVPPELMTGQPAAMERAPAAVTAPSMAIAAPTPVAAPTAVAAPAMAMAAQKVPMKAKVLGGGIASLGQPGQVASYSPAVQVVQQQPVASYTPVPHQQVASYTPVHQQPVASYTPALQQAPTQPVVSYTPAIPQVQTQPVLSYTGVVQQQASYTPNVYAPQPQAVAAPQMAPAVSQPATQKMAFGDWAVYEDELGTFYMQVSTGVQFEKPPAELMQAYQQYRAQQDHAHMQQLKQIELQKQMIDQQVFQQAQTLQAQMGINPQAAMGMNPAMMGLPQGYQVA